MLKPIAVRPSEQQIAWARAHERQRTEELIAKYGREHLNDSIREGEGTLIGLLGERITLDYFGNLVFSTGKDIYDYDLFHTLFKWRWEVKSKEQKWPGTPQAHFNATVCAANTRQACDHYVFTRVHSSLEIAWILGVLPKQLFMDRAVFYHKGDVDPTGTNGWKFSWDCYNVALRYLWPLPGDPAELFLLREKEKYFKTKQPVLS